MVMKMCNCIQTYPKSETEVRIIKMERTYVPPKKTKKLLTNSTSCEPYESVISHDIEKVLFPVPFKRELK